MINRSAYDNQNNKKLLQGLTSELVNLLLSCSYIAHISNNFGRSSKFFSIRRATKEHCGIVNTLHFDLCAPQQTSHDEYSTNPTCMLLHTKGLTTTCSRILVWGSKTQKSKHIIGQNKQMRHSEKVVKKMRNEENLTCGRGP